jgi:hydrogenase expression/formation protein HypE
MNQSDRILLGHGSGGKLSHDLISGLFMRYFSNPYLDQQTDSAVVGRDGARLAFTTDSYVVDPIFFPGGNIGKLAICGTVNDLAVSGAIPLYISTGFILEEGFAHSDLQLIVESMAAEARAAGVSIVTGDTKVVPRGKCDKIFINTAGIGYIDPMHEHIGSGRTVRPGDRIIINGTIGDHGMAILAARKELNLTSSIESDCASLNGLIREMIETSSGVRFMRDATRGGLATVLAELAERTRYGVSISEEAIPVNPKVRAICEILGFDPLYVANEGKVVIVAERREAESILAIIQKHPLGADACIIGEVTAEYPGKAWMQTAIGGKRILDMLSGEQLPRIC